MTLQELCAANGVELLDCGDGHYQLKGQLTVNYYPHSKKRTAHVIGTIKGISGITAEQAVGMCFTPPKLVPSIAKSRKPSCAERKRIYNSGVKNCHWCQISVHWGTCTLEHIIPLSLGGSNLPDNKMLACKDCNSSRGSDMPELAPW